MAKLRRKGKTFATEHYAPADLIAALHKAFMDYVPQMDGAAIRSLSRYREISVWAEPRGIFFYCGLGSLPNVPIPWKEFSSLTREDISTILFGMMKMYETYGQEAKNRAFKIVLNDRTVSDLIAMMEL